MALRPPIPPALDIALDRLLLFLAGPPALAVFVTLASLVTAGGEAVAAAGGLAASLLGWTKLCYALAALFQLAAGLAERTDGGPAAPEWWDDRAGAPDPGAATPSDGGWWHVFPNRFDAAAVGFGLTLALSLVR